MDNIISKVNYYLTQAEKEISREDINPGLALMNTSYEMGRIYGLLEILQEDMDVFIPYYDKITHRLHSIMEKEDAIYRKIKEAMI